MQKTSNDHMFYTIVYLCIHNSLKKNAWVSEWVKSGSCQSKNKNKNKNKNGTLFNS